MYTIYQYYNYVCHIYSICMYSKYRYIQMCIWYMYILHTCEHILFFNITFLLKNVKEFFTTKDYNFIIESSFEDPAK